MTNRELNAIERRFRQMRKDVRKLERRADQISGTRFEGKKSLEEEYSRLYKILNMVPYVTAFEIY
jgi:hypothetical protein